jgi:hypothetical protein
MPVMSADPDPDVLLPRRGLRLLLPDHHRRLEAKCHELLASAYGDDSRELAAAWSELEAELLDHIAAEEEVILPAYAEHSPGDAQRILADHARIRDLVTPTGVEVELHLSRAARLRRLVNALDAHAHHEDAFMYPWAQVNLPELAQRLLVVRIGRWLGVS